MSRHSLDKVIFVGSFDPFHEGHRNIVERALKLFDTVVIGVSQNDEKVSSTPLDERVESIRELFRDCPQVVVEANEGLTIDFAHQHGAQFIIKGVRDSDDFLYEQAQALWNKKHGDVETVLLVADEGLEHISSTAIRHDKL